MIFVLELKAGETNLKQWYATDKKKQQCEEYWSKDYKPFCTFQDRGGSNKDSPPKQNLSTTFITTFIILPFISMEMKSRK